MESFLVRAARVSSNVLCRIRKLTNVTKKGVAISMYTIAKNVQPADLLSVWK